MPSGTLALFCFDLIVLMGPRKTREKYGLTSPHKQGFHLLGLMLETPETADGTGSTTRDRRASPPSSRKSSTPTP